MYAGAPPATVRLEIARETGGTPRRNLNIQLTLTERPGLPVRIIVNRDLVLRSYQPLIFNRGALR